MSKFWQKYHRYFVGGVAAFTVLGAGVCAWLYSHQPKVPPSISRQVSFVIGYPAPDWPVDRASFKFQNDSKVLSFTATGSGAKLTISEQPEPDPFRDIPNYMDKVTAQMQEFTSFDSAHGTVHLTRPPSAGGNQVAVVDSQGTLTFVRSSKDLSTDNWRRYFNQLKSID